MKYIQFSEKGPRMNNEDSRNIVEIADKRTLFVVCDGIPVERSPARRYVNPSLPIGNSIPVRKTQSQKSLMQQRMPVESLMRNPATIRWGQLS